MVVRSAVIGAGVVSETHLSAASKNPRAELVAICDLDEGLARSAAAKYGVTPYVDVEELLVAEPLDLVHVCTPVQTHLPVARSAIEAGVAVVIEKPLAESVAEVDEIASLSADHDVPVTVIHQHDFDPAVRKARRLIEAGDLGAIRAVELVKTGLTRPDESNRGSWVAGLPGGEFEEGLPHHIYPLFSTGGHPRSEDDVQVRTGLVGDYEEGYTYDAAQVQYVTDAGTLCTTTMTAGGQAERTLQIQGETGSVAVDLIPQVLTRSRGSYLGSSLRKVKKNIDGCIDRLVGTAANMKLVVEDRVTGDWETETRLNQHYYQLDAVVRAVATGSPMPVPLEDARWTVAIMEQIREESRRRPERTTAVSS